MSPLTAYQQVDCQNQTPDSTVHAEQQRSMSMPGAAFIDSTSVIDLSHVAKVKGVVSNANIPLPTLAGTILKKSLPNFSYLSASEWSIDVKEDGVKKLVEEVDCISQIYESLMKLNSVGLPLQLSQVCAGRV
ncbi:hypothetical protein DFH08DRAFT_976212 [Mycena albidolilacea]|uniref:Uncharacterized protein n=1 Tax=Mycena albidolilacea TaxID=1033008 RepID=A0AAD7EAG7_9AGAR|nr:hypothetical protein DFH08DRAFT_976212 [Mycena albidolilacea]